jgi:hypothetical protein
MTNSTFTFVIAKYKGKEYLDETMYPTAKEAVEDIAAGQIDAENIAKVVEINLATGTARDVTQHVAIEVWRIFDADHVYPCKEMREWLDGFRLSTDHLYDA